VPIQFLNVDLEIKSESSLQAIVDSFGDDVDVLGCSPVGPHYQAAFESPGMPTGDPDSLVCYFCDLISKLHGTGRTAWETAYSRVFNIGFESGHEPKYIESELSPDTIAKISSVGASITITIYKGDA
jgi:hypothetical protein